VCVDPNEDEDGDWECHCHGHKHHTQEPGKQGPAEGCGKYSECDNLINVQICADGHPVQHCVDPDDMIMGNWECHCYLDNGQGSAWDTMRRWAGCEPPQIGDCSIEANYLVCENEGQICYDPDADTPDNWQCVCPQDGFTPGEKVPANCGHNECRLSLCANGADCPHDQCADQGQICVDPSPVEEDNWYCYGNVTDKAGAQDEDDSCSFLECWWWLILLLLLLCCSCCILLLLLIKRKETNTDRDETKWNKEFQAQNEDLEELIENEDGSEPERSEYKGEESEYNKSLLHGQQEQEDEL